MINNTHQIKSELQRWNDTLVKELNVIVIMDPLPACLVQLVIHWYDWLSF